MANAPSPVHAQAVASESQSYLPDSPYAAKRARNNAPKPFYSGVTAQKAYVPPSLSGSPAPLDQPVAAPPDEPAVLPVDAPLPPDIPLVNELPTPTLVPSRPLYPNRAANAVAVADSAANPTPAPEASAVTTEVAAPSAIPVAISHPTSQPAPMKLPLPKSMPEYKPYATIETQQSVPLDTRHYDVPSAAQLPQEHSAPLPPPVFTPLPAATEPEPALAPLAMPAEPVETPVTPEAVSPAPVAAAAVVPAASADTPVGNGLSEETQRILSRLPNNLDGTPKSSGGKVSLKRVDPAVEAALSGAADEDVQTYEAAGLSVQVRQPKFNSDYELEKAYNALIAGETELAIDIYQNILAQAPNDQQALFGLATTYHRVDNLDAARPLYGRLLAINPEHREALNNFLVLVAEESPQEALRQLELLEQKNPEYSPIPAQMAILYDKLGYPEESRQKMLRAAMLSPDNLVYTYNLAIMLDKQEKYADAAQLYRNLLAAERKGQAIPANVDDIQKRLTFIGSN